MKHEIEITRVIALLDEVLLVIFEDKTLHVHDVELIRNRLPDIQPFSEPETVQAVEENRERCLAAWSKEIDGAACGRTEETVEVNMDVDTDVLELTEEWCVKQTSTAEKLMTGAAALCGKAGKRGAVSSSDRTHAGDSGRVRHHPDG